MNAAVYEIRSSSRSPVVIDPRPRILQSKTPAGGSSGQTGPPQAYPSGNAPPPKAKGLTKTERLEKEMRLLFDNARELIAVGLNNSCAIYQVQRSLCKGIQQHSGEYSVTYACGQARYLWMGTSLSVAMCRLV